MTPSVRRLASTFGVAVAVNNVAQFVWIAAGARVLGVESFGLVLTCQAIYGVLQVVTDNGSGIHGARMMASEGLTPEERSELINARVILGTGSGIVGLVVVAVVSPHLFGTLVPFVLALVAFSLLNVWETYGQGDARAYATYLILRSLVLAVIALGCLASGVGMSPYVAGFCELAAVLITGFAYRAWSVPRDRILPQGETWRAVRDVGGPGLLTQATFAAGTVILGAAGNATAAAVAGVGTRLLTGLQGINGVVAAGLFPLIARGDSRADGRAAQLVPIGIVTLSLAALSIACALQSQLLGVILGEDSHDTSRALTLWIGSACASGYILHLSFAVLARRLERGLAALSLLGLVITAVAAGVASGQPTGPATLIASAGFLAGQTIVLLLIARHLRRGDHADWVSVPLLLLAVGASAVAVVAVFSSAAAAALAIAGVVVCVRLGWPLLRPPTPLTSQA